MEFSKNDILNLMDRRSFSNGTIFANLFKNTRIVTMTNFNLEVKNYLIENKHKLNKAGSKLSPNFLNYIKQNIPRVKILMDKDTKKAYISFRDFEGDRHKVYIRNQDYFAYRLILKMYKQLFEKPCYETILNDLFEKRSYLDRYFLGSIENTRFVNKNRYRTDLEFKFNIKGNEFIVVLEYLEDHHDALDSYDRDNFRLYKLKEEYEEIKAAWLIIENNLINNQRATYSKQIKKISESLISLIFDTQLLENKDEFIVHNLEIITDNRSFSEMLYESYQNQYEFVIEIEFINLFMRFKNNKCAQKYMEYFIDQYPIQVNVVLNDQSEEEPDLDSDSEEESNDSEEEYINYYDLDDNGNISKFNFEGFQLYLMNVDENYLEAGIEGKKDIYQLYIDITRELISTLEQRYDKLKSVVNQSFVII